jgi:trimeric autotransporter adhesin
VDVTPPRRRTVASGVTVAQPATAAVSPAVDVTPPRRRSVASGVSVAQPVAATVSPDVHVTPPRRRSVQSGVTVAQPAAAPTAAASAAPTPPRSRVERVAAGIETAAGAVDRVSASAERAATATGAVTSAVSSASEAVQSFGRWGATAFFVVATAIGSAAYATLHVGRLLSEMTGIPFPVVAAGVAAVAAAVLAAVVPAGVWSAALGFVTTGFSVLYGVAAAGLPILAGGLSAAATAAWGLVAPFAPVIAIVAAVAAAAYMLYKVATDWQSIPLWVKLLFPPLIAAKIAVEAIALPFRVAWSAAKMLFGLAVLPFKAAILALGLAVDAITLPFRVASGAAKLFVSAITLPFRAAYGTVKLLYDGVMLLPRALMALPGLAWKATTAISSAVAAGAKAITAAAWSAVKATASAGAAVAKWAASTIIATPGALFRGVKSSLVAIGEWGTAAGAAMQGLGGRLVEPLTRAGQQFAAYGSGLSRLAREQEVTAQDAAVLQLASARTGISIGKLAEMMRSGAPEFAGYRREAEALGLVLGDDAVAAADAYTDAQARMKSATQGLWVQLGAAVAPALKESADLMAGAVRGATAWVKEHQAAIATAFKWASALVSTGTAVAAIAGGLGTLGTFLGPVVTGLAAAAAGAALWKSGAAGGFWTAYGDQIRSIYETVRQYGARFIAFAEQTAGGITDAITAGRLDLAVQIAWSAAKVAWVTGLGEINSLTGGAFSGIIQNLASGNWSAAGEAAMSGLKIAWIEAVDFVDAQLVRLQNLAATAWAAIVNAADAAGVRIVNVADTWLEGLSTVWGEIEARGQELLAFFSGLGQGVEIIFNAMAATIKVAFAPMILQFKALLAVARMLPGVGKDAQTAVAALDEAQAQSTAATPATGAAEAGAQATAAVTAAMTAAAAATAAKTPAATAGQPPVKSLAQLRAEQRDRDLAGRQAGRTADATGDNEMREYAQGDRWAARQAEIAALRQRAAQLAAQGAQEAAAAAQKQADTLAQQLAEAKAAKDASAAQRGDVGGLQQKIADNENAEKEKKAKQSSASFGTFGSYGAALAMGGSGTAEKSLAVQEAQLRETQQLRATIADRRLVMAP